MALTAWAALASIPLWLGLLFVDRLGVALGDGAPLIGKLSDHLGVVADPGGMRFSLLVCPIACALAAVLLWLGSRARERGAWE